MTHPHPAAASSAAPAARPDALPWWRYGHVWLVIAGPAIVVVAGFITLWLAIAIPDPVVTDVGYRQGTQVHPALQAGKGSLAPAELVRNHTAATLGQPR